MTNLDDEDELPQAVPLQRWRQIAGAAITFGPSIVSIGCAVAAGYFTYTVANIKPPADISTLAVSILKSGDAPPEMRTWAAGALGIQTVSPMIVGSIKPAQP
jgi:hypothetical protein